MTEIKADYSTNYWETVARQERKKADDNMRLAAERATTIQELQSELQIVRADYLGACELVANMHAAAVGEITGPKRGVVEDVADLKKELEEAKAEIKRLEVERDNARAFLKPQFEALEDQVKQTFAEWRKEMQAIIGDSLDDFDLDEFLKERHGDG